MKFLTIKFYLLIFLGCGFNTKAIKPSLENPPSYCKAIVSQEHIASLHQFVVDVYNESMASTKGFKLAKPNANARQPFANFADPNKPIFRSQTRTGPEFHSSLCNRPQSPFFRCENEELVKLISQNSRSLNGKAEYEQFYKDLLAKTYEMSPPRPFGPLFIALPISPHYVVDKRQNPISGEMHISLVKVIVADKDHEESEDSRALKQQFVNALAKAFVEKRDQLPKVITFESVTCLP